MRLQVEPVINDAKKGIKEFHQTLIETIIAASIMIVAWIILGILNHLGVNSKLLYPLNFLTASLNGMQGGGIIGIVGGIIAKLTLLTMIVQIVIPMYKEAVNKSNGNIKEGVTKYKELLKLVFGQGIKLAGFGLIGISLALIIYAFLTVNGNFENSFVIVLALITTLRILFSQTNTVIRFFTTLFRLTPVNNAPVYSVFIGLSIGFTLSVSLAVIFSSAVLAYLLGLVIMFIGYFLIVFEKRKIKKNV